MPHGVHGNHANRRAVGDLETAAPGVSDGVEERVDLLVHQRAVRSALLQTLGLDVLVLVDAVDSQDVCRVSALAGSGVADVDAASLDVRYLHDARIRTRDEHDGFRVNAEDAPETLVGFALPVGRAVIRLKVPVGLGDAEVQQTALDGVDVEHRTQRGTADAVIAPCSSRSCSPACRR